MERKRGCQRCNLSQSIRCIRFYQSSSIESWTREHTKKKNEYRSYKSSYIFQIQNTPSWPLFAQLLNPDDLDPSCQITLSRVLSQGLQEDGAGDEVGLARETKATQVIDMLKLRTTLKDRWKMDEKWIAMIPQANVIRYNVRCCPLNSCAAFSNELCGGAQATLHLPSCHTLRLPVRHSQSAFNPAESISSTMRHIPTRSRAATLAFNSSL